MEEVYWWRCQYVTAMQAITIRKYRLKAIDLWLPFVVRNTTLPHHQSETWKISRVKSKSC